MVWLNRYEAVSAEAGILCERVKSREVHVGLKVWRVGAHDSNTSEPGRVADQSCVPG